MKNKKLILAKAAILGSMFIANTLPVFAFDAREEPTHILVQDSYLLNAQDVSDENPDENMPTPNDGDVKDEKTAGYASEEDQKDSIVTITHNIVGKSLLVDQPINVLFILDCSGSMSGGRDTTENECTKTFAQQLLKDNPRNKIGVMYFESDVCQTLDFTSDINAINSFTTHTSHGGTSFQPAIEGAGNMIDAAKSKLNAGSPMYTIFMTDGESLSYDTSVLTAYKNNLFGIFSMHTVYGIGICMGSVNQGITDIASPGKDIACPDLNSFTTAMKDVASTMQEGYPKAVKLSEKVNERFQLVLDENHPIKINGKEYTTKESLPNGFTYENNELSVNIGDFTNDKPNYTLSYCVKEIAEKEEGVEAVTNNSNLSYVPAKVKNNELVYDKTPTVDKLYEPKYKTEESKIDATLTSNFETESIIARDEAVSYTLKIENKGTLDLENFYANIEIPEGMDYVDKKEPVYEYIEATGLNAGTEDDPVIVSAEEDLDLDLDEDTDLDSDVDNEVNTNEDIPEKEGYDEETRKVYYKIPKLEKGQSVELTVNVKPNGTTESMTTIAGIGLTEESNIKTNDITHTLEEIKIEMPPKEKLFTKTATAKTTGLSQKNYLIIAGVLVLGLLVGLGTTIVVKKKNKFKYK